LTQTAIFIGADSIGALGSFRRSTDTERMPPRPVPVLVVLTVCAALVVTAAVMTATAIALTADGPFNLVRLIATDEVFATHARYLGSLIRQAPALAGIRAGVTDTYWLAVLLGVGYLVFPAVVWSGALVFTRTDARAFAAVAITAGVTAVATWFCSVSESVFAVALTGLVSVLLWRSKQWRWGVTLLACMASLILIASYETALLTSTVLGLWAIARCRAAPTRLERAGCAFIALSSAAAIVVGVSGSFTGPNDSNSQSFAYFVVSLEPTRIYAALICGLVVIAGFLVSDRRLQMLLFTGGLVGALLATAGLEMTASTAYAARGAAVIAVFGLQIFLALLWRRRADPAELGTVPPVQARWALVVPVIFVALMCIANVRALDGWSRGLAAFRDEVDAARGLVYIDDVVPPDRRQAVWSWTGPSLSLVVRSSPQGGILVDRHPGFVPFAPRDARSQIPDDYTWRR
jgi:hypothetical protein